jgi:3-hydroxyisobutyrate dehydrogenase-like beta-hydroxyacid dehydrogenase
MAKVGFIGLGVMGGQMVNRLMSKGQQRHRLSKHSRRLRRPVAKQQPTRMKQKRGHL